MLFAPMVPEEPTCTEIAVAPRAQFGLERLLDTIQSVKLSTYPSGRVAS